MSDHQRIIILDFGGQYTQLIARRVRENNVYSEVVPWSMPAGEIVFRKPAGIILSGGPASVCDPDAPHCDPAVYDLGVPVLGICYGMQLTAHLLGGRVERAKERDDSTVTRLLLCKYLEYDIEGADTTSTNLYQSSINDKMRCTYSHYSRSYSAS